LPREQGKQFASPSAFALHAKRLDEITGPPANGGVEVATLLDGQLIDRPAYPLLGDSWH
jgi:hypothetical protein